MSLKWRVLRGPEEAVRAKGALFSLFERCFGRALPEAVWRRFYLDNPYGEAVSFAGFEGDRMLAHHVFIPQELKNEVEETLTYWLLISLMVDPEARGQGAFRTMLEMSHDFCAGSDKDFILGFPNQESYPLLASLFDWQTIYEEPLLDWSPNLEAAEIGTVERLNDWRLGAGWGPPLDERYLEWRCSQGDYEALQIPGAKLVGKTYGTSWNLLDLEMLSPSATRAISGLLLRRGLSGLTLLGHHALQLGLSSTETRSHGGYTLRMCMASPKGCYDFSTFRMNLLATDTF